MAQSLYHLTLVNAPREHPAVSRLPLTWNDLRKCFELRKMNTQLFTRLFHHIRYWNWPWISEHVQLDEAFIYRYCRHIDWTKISRHQRLTVDLIAMFEVDINWLELSANPKLTVDIIALYPTRLDWGLVCQTIAFTEHQIEQFLPYIAWYELSHKSTLSETFIEQHRDKVHWPRITARQTLSDAFITRNAAWVDWDYISRHRPMKHKFIEDHADYVDWSYVSGAQVLDEPFMLTNTKRIVWEEAAFVQVMSEQFFEDNAPKTPAVWAAFTAGHTLTLDFIRRNIAYLPARELTRFQTFTLEHLDEFADHLDWKYLSVVHPFERPGTGEVDTAFIRRHAHRFTWATLVQSHTLPVDILLENSARFLSSQIMQDIPIETLRLHPELVNREWITQNCPLTVEYLRAAEAFVSWENLIYRHLPAEVVEAFPANINLTRFPIFQPPMHPAWIARQVTSGRVWATETDVDPRNWPLYSISTTITRISDPADEFFRRNQALIIANPRTIARGGTHILLNTMVAVKHLVSPEIADRIKYECVLAELHVPSSWDYLERLSPARWDALVCTRRLSEAFMRRFKHKISWRRVAYYQKRAFSVQFIREFAAQLDLRYVQLPYDITPDYLREFGPLHNWPRMTPDFQEWQMELYKDYCDFSAPPHTHLSDAFIARHYSNHIRALSMGDDDDDDDFEANYIDVQWTNLRETNTELAAPQRHRLKQLEAMVDKRWARVSSQPIKMTASILLLRDQLENQVKLTPYSAYKESLTATRLSQDAPLDISDACTRQFWTRMRLPDAIIRRFIKMVDWRDISQHQQLDENFLAEFKDKVDWRAISRYQVLSESTIRRFQDYVIWPVICQYQKLTETFIGEFADRVNWEAVSPYSLCY